MVGRTVVDDGELELLDANRACRVLAGHSHGVWWSSVVGRLPFRQAAIARMFRSRCRHEITPVTRVDLHTRRRGIDQLSV